MGAKRTQSRRCTPFYKMQGWVIVYLPGGDVYQMVSAPEPYSKTQRMVERGMRYAAAVAQVYWWFKA